MKVAKRVFLFVLVNILVMATITIVTSLLGLQPYLSGYGINIEALAIFCLIWGFGGAFISLALSKVMAKMMMGVKVIEPGAAAGELGWLVQTVHHMARRAQLDKMPEVGIYESDEVNAFATGPTKNNSLVAVSTGLLRRMSRQEVEGVLGHEVAHIANGDMVTMTLIQGVVNAFVMFFARIIAWAISQNVDEDKRHIVHFVAVIVLQIALSFLGMFVVAYFSRVREFRADAGSARIAGKDNMVAALRSLQRTFEPVTNDEDAFSTMKISNRRKGGLMALLSTHPSLEERIARLQQTA